MATFSFVRSVFNCDDASSLKLANGNRFRRKLPDDRSLGYLHKLYAPLDHARLERMSDAIGRQLPEEFQSFLQWSNGASLFDSHIHVFGSVERLARSIDPESQQPISIEDSNRVFSVANIDRWNEGWTKIGSVVGWESSYGIELHRDGSCTVRSEVGDLTAPSLSQCLATIIDRISPCFSCDGIIDRSYAEIETAFSSLIRGH